MKTLSRRSVLSTIIPGSLLVLALPGRARADQPHMQAALDALRTAKGELEAATSDKGGHRKKALDHVAMAMAEVERGIQFDRKH